MKRWISRLIMSFFALVLAVGIACAGDSVTVSGLLAEDVMVPLTLIKELRQITEEVVPVTSAGVESHYAATGAVFSDLLAHYGKRQEDILGIRLVASDGYSIDVPRDILMERQIILAYIVDGMPLEQDGESLRVVIPGERAMYWVRNLSRIEVIDQIQRAEVRTLRFLESLAEMGPLEDYPYFGHVDQAMKIKETLEYLEINEQPERVFFKASDGFEKNEAYDEFVSGYIKITGRSAPLFLSPELPEGMHVRDIVFFLFGDNAFASLTQAFNYYEPKMVDDVVGISFLELMTDLEMAQGDMYRLTALDGYQIEVTDEDMAQGYVSFYEGQVCSYFPGLPPNTSVRSLYTVEVLQ